MNKLTLQINNLEALERLIGGDSQVEIEIRNSVVQKFAEKYLKPLANSDPITKTLAQIRAEIDRQVCEQCAKEIAKFEKSYGGSITNVKLHANIKAEIDSQVRNVVDTTVRNNVDEAIKFWANDKELKERIDKRFEYYTTELINTEIKSRIDKLKAKL